MFNRLLLLCDGDSVSLFLWSLRRCATGYDGLSVLMYSRKRSVCIVAHAPVLAALHGPHGEPRSDRIFLVLHSSHFASRTTFVSALVIKLTIGIVLLTYVPQPRQPPDVGIVASFPWPNGVFV